MVTKNTPSAEECSDSQIQRGQSSEIKEEVLHIQTVRQFQHTGINKDAQFVIWGIPSLSVHRISL